MAEPERPDDADASEHEASAAADPVPPRDVRDTAEEPGVTAGGDDLAAPPDADDTADDTADDIADPDDDLAEGRDRGRTLLWLVAVFAIALGTAGIAAGANLLPGERTRPELTYRGDAAMAPRLDALRQDVARLRDRVRELGDLGRETLVAVVARRTDAARDLLIEGDAIATAIGADVDRLGTEVARLPYDRTSDRVSRSTRDRLDALTAALEAAAPLDAQWATLQNGVLPAIELADLLEAHDAEAFAGVSEGVKARYPHALERIRAAVAILDEARSLRDALAPSTDVSTLDEWLLRNRRYDEALLRLYGVLGSGVDPAGADVVAAFEEVQRAQEQLPPDTRALVIVMDDIAKVAATGAADAIERAVGDVEDALTVLSAPRPSGPAPVASP